MSPERSVTYVSGTDNFGLVGERGFEPPTPGPENRTRSSWVNVLKLLQRCFGHLSLAQTPHFKVNVKSSMIVPIDHSTPKFDTLGGLGFRL
jgi:hypothetical protein